MDDLQGMDDEVSTLKNELESFSRNVTSYTGLDELEDAIAGTKVPTTISYNTTLECLCIFTHCFLKTISLSLGFGPQIY